MVQLLAYILYLLNSWKATFATFRNLWKKSPYQLLSEMTHLSPFAFTLTVYLLICTFSNTFSYPLHRADQIDSAYQYELAVNQQPLVRARNQQPIRYVRNDDYFDEGPAGNSSFFVLGLFAIIIGVPCVLCYAQKRKFLAVFYVFLNLFFRRRHLCVLWRWRGLKSLSKEQTL